MILLYATCAFMVAKCQGISWYPNMVTIEGKPIICVKLITQKLGHNTNHPKFFVCYDVKEGIIGKKHILFETRA